MQKIRSGFETNSSSAHSLVISSDCTPILTTTASFGHVDHNNVLHVEGNTEFGWSWEIWDSPADKVNYLWLDSSYGRDGGKYFHLRLKDLLMRKLDMDDVVFTISDEKYPYIDHESVGLTSRIRDVSDEVLWEFITNPNSMVRGGNDNSEGPWDSYPPINE